MGRQGTTVLTLPPYLYTLGLLLGGPEVGKGGGGGGVT